MLIQISAGKSPLECEFACKMLFDDLLKEYPKLKVVSVNYRNKECLKSAVLFSEDDLSYLEGTVQWIGKSPYRPHHARKNWFIDVSIIKERCSFDNKEEIVYDTMKSRGNGGQHINRTMSAVRAIHIPTGKCAISSDERSQSQNKKMAYLRLMDKLNESELAVNMYLLI